MSEIDGRSIERIGKSREAPPIFRQGNSIGCGNLAAIGVTMGCYESIRFDGDRAQRRAPLAPLRGTTPDTGGLMLARSCLTIAAFALCCSTANAQQKAFYAGKQLTILVNYDAGGPTDLEARLLSRHLGRHIPGNPRIIVQNMGGAAGLIGTKYLGEIAPRDGTMMGYFTGATQRYVSNPERFNVDFRTYEFIAVLPSGRIHFMRTDVPPGIKRAADVIKGENIVVGGLGPQQPKDMAMRLTLDMLGARYSYVTGYNSSAQAMLALQRGEISYYADSPPLYKTKIAPEVKEGKLIPLFYDPGFDGTAFSVPAYMKDHPIQPFHELYRSIKGTMPSGQLWEAYKSMLLVNGTMYRMLTLPPEAPRDTVGALRAAVVKLAADKQYIDEALKLMGDAPEYVTSTTLNDEVRKALTIDPKLKDFMDAYGKRVAK
jgi:tripartite-type tricarboxylate transporter receptor subunit TctC